MPKDRIPPHVGTAEHVAVADPAVRFSYSTADQPRVQRALIRTIEFCGGQRRLRRLYRRGARLRSPGETFFHAAVRLLALEVRFDRAALLRIPATGPVLFIANHPYGVLDGIVLTWLALQCRADVKVLANGVLTRVPETRDHLLPVDFGQTETATTINLASRREAIRWLADGHAIGMFPGGGVSTSERPLSRPALDLPWAPFAAKLLHMAKATVVPVHFSGQNSRLFQIASHVSLTLRLSLLFRETARRIGTRFDVAVGQPVPYSQFARFDDRATLLTDLRRRTFALAPVDGVDRMRHGRVRDASKENARAA